MSNEALLAITQQYPGKFYALSGVNPLRGPDNVKEAESFLRDHGFKGIALDPANYEVQMLADDERLNPYYELCLAYDCPAVLTIGPVGGPDISWAHPLQVDRLAARYPELKIVVAHGCWPYSNELCGVAARRRNVYMMPDLYFPGPPGEDDFIAAINSFGADQFVFATAYPGRPIQLTVEQYKKMPLKAGALDKVFYWNAARLLKLDS